MSLRYASILLDRAIPKALDYQVPENCDIEVGSLVEVPLMRQKAKGYVLAIKDQPDYPKCKAISQLLSKAPLISPDLLELAHWLSRYYCTPLQKTLKMMLPKRIREQAQVQHPLWVKKTKTKKEIQSYILTFRSKKPAQAAILDVMLKVKGGILLAELLERSKSSRSSVLSLEKEGLIQSEPLPDSEREVFANEYFQTQEKKLNSEQQLAFDKILDSLKNKPKNFLLFGITGSGKTEVYLQAISRCLEMGKTALLLVPEISLTPQTCERICSRFSEHVAIIHSRLTARQRQLEWEAIEKGEAKIVVGARSALFAPLKNLGLIILDEEQEVSYKSESSPYYHAREVALKRAEITQSTAIFGSATPSLESYHSAQNGQLELLTLSVRAAQAKLPKVTILDMKPEYDKQKGLTLLSSQLLSAIDERRKRGEQSLLFLNRRGYYSCARCQDCSHVIQCPHCDVTLTFHLSTRSLKCHLCAYTRPPPSQCPSCRSPKLQFQGKGTEHIEKTLRKIIPELRVMRIDADSTAKKGSLEKLLGDFKAGKADVLVGTQMIAKGHHFPSVTLVAALNPDQMLYLPDFRASQYLFEQLVQVAGRSGRSVLEGEVLLQTSSPDHPLYRHVKNQDYLSFYKEEIEVRKIFHYPPYCHLIKCLVVEADPVRCQKVAQACWQFLSKNLPSCCQLSPVCPAGHSKIQDEHRYQFLIKAPYIEPLSPLFFKLQEKLPKKNLLKIDIDPCHVF